jgi:hypothetical protein
VRRGRDLGIMGDGSADGLDGLEGSVVVRAAVVLALSS